MGNGDNNRMIILPQSQPALWAIRLAGVVVADGITHVGELTGVNPDYETITGEGEAAFLAAAVGKAGNYRPLPDVGQWCEGGVIYSYNGGFVICRQSHVRTEHDPATVPTLFMVYRADAEATIEWVAGEPVSVGMRRTYGGKTWVCVQAHVTESTWTPPAVPALWREVVVVPPTAEWAAGVAYKVGDRVTYQGATYECRQAHTSIATWTPAAVPALWLRL